MKELKNDRINGDTHKRFYCFLSGTDDTELHGDN